jgi:exonuclease VII small subunit
MAEKYRRKCMRQKGEECKGCGSGRNVVAHHIDGGRSNNDISNLIPLCKRCHSALHNSELTVDDVLSEAWPDEELDGEMVNLSTRVPRWAKKQIEQIAEEAGESQAAVTRELIESGVAKQTYV